MKTLILSVLFVAASLSFAHGNKVEVLAWANSVALEQFAADKSKEIKKKLIGMKSRLKGAAVQIQVYYGPDKSFVAYECTMDHSVEPEVMNCIEQ